MKTKTISYLDAKEVFNKLPLKAYEDLVYYLDEFIECSSGNEVTLMLMTINDTIALINKLLEQTKLIMPKTHQVYINKLIGYIQTLPEHGIHFINIEKR